METLDEIKRREAERHSLKSILRGQERSNVQNLVICLVLIIILVAIGFGVANIDFAFRGASESSEQSSGQQNPQSVEVKIQ